MMTQKKIIVRNPDSTRPWQHVLEPLAGYLMLAESLWKSPEKFSRGWNFGPKERDAQSVRNVMNAFCKCWGGEAGYVIRKDLRAPHEAGYLKLDSSQAQKLLLWKPRWNSQAAVQKTVEWYKAYLEKENLLKITAAQIKSYK